MQLIAGNWKMVGTVAWAQDLVKGLRAANVEDLGVEVAVCPPFTALYAVNEALKGSKISLGAQNMFWKEQGAYTSEISGPMLTELGVAYVIIGHSETRGRFGVAEPDFNANVLALFGENDETVNRKVKAALGYGLKPIICIGETLAERQAGTTDSVIATQVKGALAGLDAGVIGGLVFAYEPVWAIGTGEVCDSAEANRVCGLVRQTAMDLYGAEAVKGLRVQYGGSVKPENARELLGQPEIDGALVGGAALKADSFAEIIRNAKR